MSRRPIESTQYLSIRYSQRLADNDIVASVGTRGDSYDNAMIESFNGLFKWELICPRGPWRALQDVEFATLEYTDWYNHRRSHSALLAGRGNYTTPADHETAYYRQQSTATPAVTQQPKSLLNSEDVRGGVGRRRLTCYRTGPARCGCVAWDASMSPACFSDLPAAGRSGTSDVTS